jgi:hypothetical protein
MNGSTALLTTARSASNALIPTTTTMRASATTFMPTVKTRITPTRGTLAVGKNTLVKLPILNLLRKRISIVASTLLITFHLPLRME